MESPNDRLRHYIKTWYGTLEAFGKVVGMTDGRLSNYQRGNRGMDLEVLEKFAVEGMNIDWLLTGRGEMRASAEPEHHAQQRRQTLIEARALVIQLARLLEEMDRHG